MHVAAFIVHELGADTVKLYEYDSLVGPKNKHVIYTFDAKNILAEFAPENADESTPYLMMVLLPLYPCPFFSAAISQRLNKNLLIYRSAPFSAHTKSTTEVYSMMLPASGQLCVMAQGMVKTKG